MVCNCFYMEGLTVLWISNNSFMALQEKMSSL